jgi:hypothetical protein
MIKKYLITIVLCSCMPVLAQSYSPIEKLENSLFGMTYPNDNEQKRIERLEKNIYGAIQTGNVNSRIEHLSKDLNVDLMGQEITPSKYTEFEEKEDNSVDYPVINEIERQIFNKEFKNQKLEKRLSNIEQKVFNKVYTNEDLSTRTERLKSVIAVKTNEPEDYEVENTYNTLSMAQPTIDKKYSSNINKILNAMEKKIFKHTYSNESEDVRIERLEENMFNTSFPQDSIESRLERLALAYQATKTSKKYDTNKISQHVGTAMQVGMFLLMILAMVL